MSTQGIWKEEDSPPACSVATLWESARSSQAKVCSKLHRGQSAEDKQLWDLTLEEVQQGGLLGPFTVDQVEEHAGKLWVPARRFPIQQGTKLRPIDDFSEYGINSAFGSSEKISLKGVEHFPHGFLPIWQPWLGDLGQGQKAVCWQGTVC